MQAMINIDGQVMPTSGAHVSATDRGFLYGDGVFETMRICNGVAFALEEHLELLLHACSALEIVLPCSQDDMAQRVRATLDQAQAQEGMVRMVVSRASVPWGRLSVSTPGSFVVMVLPLPAERLSAARGTNAMTVLIPAVEDDPAVPAGLKTTSYLPRLLRLQRVRQAGVQCAITVDRFGRLVDGNTANVWVYWQGAWHTPPESVGARPGVTRRLLLEQGELPTRITPLSRDVLHEAEALCLSSSIQEIVHIVEVDQQPVGRGRGAPSPHGEAFASVLARIRQRRCGVAA